MVMHLIKAMATPPKNIIFGSSRGKILIPQFGILLENGGLLLYIKSYTTIAVQIGVTISFSISSMQNKMSCGFCRMDLAFIVNFSMPNLVTMNIPRFSNKTIAQIILVI